MKPIQVAKCVACDGKQVQTSRVPRGPDWKPMAGGLYYRTCALCRGTGKTLVKSK
jgi:hypothetical protein